MASIVHPKPQVWQMLLAMLGILLLLAPKGIPGRFLGMLLLLPVVLIKPDKLEQGEINLTF
jgi:competence protein ComEC